jgi:cytochrome P450
VRTEIQAAFPGEIGEENGDIAGILEHLPILNGVINETLRLYPTVPKVLRQAVCDTIIGRHRIPKGATIIISQWALQRSPHIWGPDAEEFRPERWITDGKPNQSGGGESNYHMATFLHGPRTCIGHSFARAELRCLLAMMLKTFTWELGMPDEQVAPAGVITIKPVNGLWLKLKKLEN